MAIITAQQVLAKLPTLSQEELDRIRKEAEKLFARALKSANETIRRIELEVNSKHYCK